MTTTPKLLIDTNVWLDAFLEARPNHGSAVALFDFSLQREITLLYAATSMQDVHYLISSALKQALRQSNAHPSASDYESIAHAAWGRIEDMAEMGFGVGCDESDLWLARKYRNVHGEFDDNLIIATAQRAGADFVVTGDKRLILHCPVAALDPADMLDHLQKTL